VRIRAEHGAEYLSFFLDIDLSSCKRDVHVHFWAMRGFKKGGGSRPTAPATILDAYILGKAHHASFKPVTRGPRARTQGRRSVRAAAHAAVEYLERRELLSVTLSGTVYYDDNNNGTRDDGEKGAPGWNIYYEGFGELLGHEFPPPTAVSGPQGAYSMEGDGGSP